MAIYPDGHARRDERLACALRAHTAALGGKVSMSHKRLGFMQLTIPCGFGLYYAWYLIAFFGLFMFVPGDHSFVPLHIGQVVFFAGSIVVTGVLLAWFHRVNSVAIGHMRFLYLASFLPALPLPLIIIAGAAWGWQPPAWLAYSAFFLAGGSVGFGFMLWEDVTTHGYLNRGVIAHGTIFCTGGIVFLAATFLLDTIGTCTVALLALCASTALLAFITPRCDLLEDKPVAPVRAYFHDVWHIDIVIAVINMAFGYAFIMLYNLDNLLLLTTMGIAIVADMAFSIVVGRGKWIQFAGWARVCGAFVSCALIALVLPNNILESVALSTIVIFWFAFRTMNGGSLTDLANNNGFSMLYSATRGKMPANVGFTLGLALGVGAVATGDPVVSGTYAPLALVAIFIFAALFFLPFDNESKTAGYKTLALVEMHESPEADLANACKQLTQQYKLSPRESEVLAYLVRGRNAKHVAEKLFISESTVKTHISNIYRKLTIHSQQELLDLLEKM